MTKTSIWLRMDEFEAINRLKGDISTSLWIRRAIRSALSSGKGLPTDSPEAASTTAVVEETVVTPTTHHYHQRTEEEVEA